jgi:hypothetical protein
MKNIMTKNKISIKDIIDFVHKAMVCGFSVYNRYGVDFAFDVENTENSITFIIKSNKIEIYSDNSGLLVVENPMSDREEVDLKALQIDIKEYNEEKALNVFNNFFTNTVDKPTNIDDLNDED